MKRILCSVDGSDHADIALLAAMELASKFEAELSHVTVNVAFGASPRGPQALVWTKDEAQAILDAAAALVSKNGQKVSGATVVVAREASGGIIDYAIKHDIDAIVLGTGDKRGLSRLFLGSVAADVAHRAPCTVIIAR